MQPDLPKPPIETRPQAETSQDWGAVSIEDRQAHIRALAELALSLREREAPGPQIWSELTGAAVAAYAGTELPTARQADFVIQDLAVVILGPFSLKYLRWFDKITPDLVQDPLVNQFFAELGRLGLPPAEPLPEWRAAGYVGKLDDAVDPGLDRHFAAHFRAEINDSTDNQIFHTFFYQFMAYVTKAALTIRAASVYHEIADKGGSTHDHTAALLGIRTGTELRRRRDSGEPGFGDWPGLILAAYAKDAPEGLSPAAAEFRRETDALVAKPGTLDGMLRGVEYAIIRLVNKEK